MTTTLHRLRKLVGAEAIVHRAGSLSLDPRYCWVDVWALEHDLLALDKACRAAGVSAVVEAAGRLCSRYRGAFLGTASEQPWALALRERLQGKVLRAVWSGADRLTGEERHEEAVRCLESALEMDPLAEETYRRLMQSQLARGHRAEALSTYERCRKTLAARLGLEPSGDTEAVRRRIQAG